ncbi:lysylphosphatidylglycerol synthase transmembrane domain-containing protein [Gymnodinialimonas sp. 2305UL16-5]|uniref:lysylphosphatidylglycerol synthase transmembrane domain-containing protein n=1 Tax=Gymnodinialimonas mytili TaxID=3126503 RepID=UPI00309B88A2
MGRAWPLPQKGMTLLRVAVLIACIVLLWRAVDWREALDLLWQADLRWLGAAVLLLNLQTLLSTQRWRLTAAQLGIHIGPVDAVREYYHSQIMNQSLPGGVVGDARRALRARDQAGLLASSQAVVFERVAGQIGLLALLALGLTVTFAAPGLQNWPDWLATPAASIASIALLAVFVMATSLWLNHRAASLFHKGTRSFRQAVLAPNVWRQQAVLSLATASCNVAAFAFCASALGLTLPVLATITVVPLILFAMVLPLSVGGWGLREGAAAMLFPAIGFSMGEGLTTSVAFGLVILASVLPGFVIGWTRPKIANPTVSASEGLPRQVEP